MLRAGEGNTHLKQDTSYLYNAEFRALCVDWFRESRLMRFLARTDRQKQQHGAGNVELIRTSDAKSEIQENRCSRIVRSQLIYIATMCTWNGLFPFKTDALFATPTINGTAHLVASAGAELRADFVAAEFCAGAEHDRML